MFQTHLTLEPSATVAINSQALEKRARGERVYNLSAGEPMLPPHPLVAEAARQAIKDGKTLYPPVAGLPELRQAAINWMNYTYFTTYAIKNSVVTCGGKFGIFAVLQAMLQPGDEVLIAAPYWVSYPQMVKLFGGIPRIINTEEKNGWKINLDQLEQLTNPPSQGGTRGVLAKVKILILNNAANPTGAVYSREELKNILAWAAEHNLLVISDEVYSGLVYDGAKYFSCGSFPEYQDRVVVIQSCSKHFAMTGWRVGFVFGPEEIIKVVTMLQSQSTTGTSSISQWAALGALENAAGIIRSVQKSMRERRNVFIDTFNELFDVTLESPASGLYVFFSLEKLGVKNKSSVAFCEELIKEANIALVPGSAFGMEGYARASFGATPKELKESIEELARFTYGN